MIETKKLYDLDAYATEFDAVVVSCEEKTSTESKEMNGGSTVYEVVLDQTLFFPEEGGQTSDQGTINGIKVLDVQMKKGVIIHTIAARLAVDTAVHGVINWNHRFNNMQQHTGEHIFSGLVHQKFGYDNVGFHLSDQVVTMDFSGVLTQEQAAEIELKANEVILKNLPVLVSFPSKSELFSMEYRSKIEIEGQVRIVTIPDTDVCACCAPHVKSTGEIGILKIMSMQNYKGGVRLSILCGLRALQAFRSQNALLAELSGLLSANQDTLVSSVQKLKDNNQSLKYDLIQEKQRFLMAKLAQIPEDEVNVFLFEEGLDQLVMRNTVNELTAVHPGICGVFNGNDESGYQFILGSAGKDTRTVMAQLKDQFNARGGGSALMVQGSVSAAKERIREVLEG